MDTTTVPAPLTDRVTVPTDGGHLALAITRLADQLAELESDDRAWCLTLLAEGIRPVIADLAHGA